MILSKTHKFIYFCNSKTASTSIEQILRSYDEGDQYRFSAKDLFGAKHIPPSLAQALVPRDLWRACFKFVFVRNPYDWFVSQWFHNFGHRHPDASIHGQPPSAMPINLNARDSNRSSVELTKVLPFTRDDVRHLYEFLRKRFRTLPYHHGKFQLCYLLDADGRKIVDHVGRFENLEADFSSILERIGLDGRLPRLNAKPHQPYWNYFTPESAGLVHELWKPDFEALGYSEALTG